MADAPSGLTCELCDVPLPAVHYVVDFAVEGESNFHQLEVCERCYQRVMQQERVA